MVTTQQGASPPPVEEINDIISEDVFLLPASIAQQRFWALDQFEPGSAALNMPLRLRLKGALDIPVLNRALNEVIQRHETLRTTFSVVEGKLMQAIAAERTMRLPVTDLRELPEPEREELLEQIVHEEAHSVLSLENGPLIKPLLIRVADDDAILTLTLHHIICDGWSNGILVNELGTLYEALLTDQPSPLPELELQYADFAAWQQDWTENESQEQLAYWKQQLQGKLPVLTLPTDRPRPIGRRYPGDIQSLLLPDTLMRSLNAFCRQEDCTPYMLFLAAFTTLLHRYSNQSDILVGSPTANRPQVELEGLIGLFSNAMILRCDASGDPTFRTFLGRVRDLSLGAFSHADLPFERLMEEIPPDPDRGNTPLLQAYFIYQKAFMQPMELPGLTLTPLRSVSSGAVFDLSCGILERAEGVRIQMEYNTALFDKETVVQMVDRFRAILEYVVTRPNARLSEIPILSEADESALAEKRAAMQTAAPLGADAARVYTAPRTPLETRLAALWEEIMGISPIGIHDDFFALGGHSLLAIRLFAGIEQEFEQKLPLATLFRARTVAQLGALMNGESQNTLPPSFVPIQPNGTNPPLFCMHRNDGIVMCYETMAQHLDPNQPVYGIEAGLLHGETVELTTVEEMAVHYARHIMSFYPSGPYLLAGSSFGGILAFETAHQLLRHGKKVALVALLDTFAPVAFQENLLAMPVSNRMSLHLEAMQGMDAKGKLEYLMRGVKKRAQEALHGKPLDVDEKIVDDKKVVPELLRRVQKIADDSVLYYHPGVYPGRLLIFRATDRNRFAHYDPELWWGGMAAEGIELYDVPGNHLGMLKLPDVTHLATELRSCISRALAKQSEGKTGE